jgi:PAS domain S-box-containing protein
VIEPDPALRTALEEALAGAVERPSEAPKRPSYPPDQEAVPVVIFGPTAPLDVGRLKHETRRGGAPIVLAASDDTPRLVAALGAGSEAMVWPASPSELVERVRAASQRQRTLRTLEIEQRDLEGLLNLSETLLTTHDIEATLYQIARRMAEVMRSERCSVILLDEDAELGFVVAASDDASVRNHPIPVASNYPEILEVVRTRAPVVIDDVGRDPLFDGVRDKIKSKRVGSTALFPVLLDGRVQGVLHLRGADVRTTGFTERQLRFVTIVANVTAIAVRNARLYQSIRERTERVFSARLRAERRIKQLEKYQRFFDLAGDGLIIVDGRGRILYANREAQSMLGFDANDITQIGLFDIVEAGARATLEDLIEGFKAGRHRRRIDLSIISSSGEVKILSLSTAPLLEGDMRDSLAPPALVSGDSEPPPPGTEIAAIITCRDVTEVRRMGDELRSTKDFLANLIESSADAIVSADRRGRIILFNGSAERITGYRREKVVRRMNISKLYRPGVAREIMGRLRSRGTDGAPPRVQSARLELVASDGELVPISLAAALIFDGGKEIASVGIFSDLRERIRIEEKLADAQRQLEVTERQAAIVELAGAAAHELSQPLTSIVGSAELMARKLESASPAHGLLSRILSECDRMEEILKKIGQITKYETKPYLGSTHILDLDAASRSGGKS